MAEKTVSVRLAARVDQYVAGMRAAAASTTGFAATTERNLTRVGTQMQNVGRMATIGVSLPIVAAAGFAVKAAVDWESAWAGVTKTVDGTVQEMAVLEQGLRDMTKEVSASHGEIAAVAEAAGALGVAQGDILDFTRVMVDLGETTDLTSDQAATAIAQMMNVMQTAPDDVDNLGAALVHLGNNGASTESQILDMATRIAGAGEIVGLSEAEVLGFSSALASMGIEAEAGGSAFSRVISDISKAVSQGGEDLDTFASVAGVSASAFATAFREDPAAAIVSFVDGLGRIHASGGDVFTVLDELGLADVRVSRALLSMATSGDLLTESLQQGEQAWADNTALAEEAAKRYDTSGARFEMVRNKIVDLFIDLGNIMLPAVEAVVGAIGTLADLFQRLPQPVQVAVGGFLALVAAMGPISFLAGMFIKNLTSITSGMSKLGPSASTASKAFGALGIALTVGIIGYQAFTDEQRKTDEITRTVSQGLLLQMASLFAAADAAGVAGEAIDGVALANEALSLALTEGYDDLASAFATFNVDADQLMTILGQMGTSPVTALDNLARSFGFTAEQADALSRVNFDAFGLWRQQADSLAQSVGIAEDDFLSFGNAVGQLQFAMDNVDVQQIARDFLNAQVSVNGYEGSLVAAAEKEAGFGRTTGDALVVLGFWTEELANADAATREAVLGSDAYQAALAALPPELQALVSGATDAGGAIEEMASVAGSAIDTMSDWRSAIEDAATVAGIYTDAFDQALGSAGDLERAKDSLRTTFAGFGEAVDDDTTSLDENTEAGRTNRGAIFDMADEVKALTQANIDAGMPLQHVTNEYLHNRSALFDAAEAAGFNRGEVIALLDTYGLTPELITTTMNIAGDALDQWRIERYLDKLDEIPEHIASDIEALIDQGKYDEAIAMLDAIPDEEVTLRVRVESTRVTVSSDGRSVNVGRGPTATLASGAYIGQVDSAGLPALLHSDEVVLPLSDPARMATLLGMSEVGPRVAAAFGNLMPVPQTALAPAPAAPVVAPGGNINTGDIHVGSRQDLPDLYNELGRVQFLSQFAGSAA